MTNEGRINVDTGGGGGAGDPAGTSRVRGAAAGRRGAQHDGTGQGGRGGNQASRAPGATAGQGGVQQGGGGGGPRLVVGVTGQGGSGSNPASRVPGATDGQGGVQQEGSGGGPRVVGATDGQGGVQQGGSGGGPRVVGGGDPESGQSDGGVRMTRQKTRAKAKTGTAVVADRVLNNAADEVLEEESDEPDIGKTLHAKDGKLRFVTARGFTAGSSVQ